MKAIRVHRFGGPEVLQLEEVPDPKPGPGQVVIRTRAIGINPVETYVREGKYGSKDFPYTPGSDAAGTIDSIGSGVTQFKPRQRVYTSGSISGTYAELALCKEDQVHPLPENTSFEQGAAVGVPYATAYYGLFLRAKPLAGETILVDGASGSVGTAAVQLAVAFGLTVIGSAGTDKGLHLVRQQGANHVINHYDSGYPKQVMDLTGGAGANIVLEMAAHHNLGKILGVLANEGRVIVIGSRGPVEINPRDSMSRTADIRGMTLMNATPKELKGIHAAIIVGLKNGTLRPILNQSFALAEAAKAHEMVLAPGSHGKIVLVP